MQRSPLSTSAEQPHFIGSWMLGQPALCEELVQFFEDHSEQHTQGKMAGGLNLEAKHSTDLSIRPRDLEREDHKPLRRYMEALYQCHQDYLLQWPFLKSVLSQVDVGSFNLQRYEPGGHFRMLHSERTTLATSHRILAWMTYLNDVEDGGATRFEHQGISVQPRQGQTLIWPAEWTHAHRGEVLNKGRKYIVTGWMHFPGPR